MNDDINAYFETEINFWKRISQDFLILENGAAIAYVTGVASENLNGITQIKKIDNPSRTFELANAFFDRHAVSWTWVINEDCCDKAFDEISQAHHFIQTDEIVAMMAYLNKNFLISNSQLNFIEFRNDLVLWEQPMKEAFEFTEECAQQYVKAHIRSLNSKKFQHYVGLLEGLPITSLTLSSQRKNCRLDDVGTSPEFQRKGFATTLLKHTLNVARDQGFEKCYLSASSSGLKLYKKLGFCSLFKMKIFSKNKTLLQS